LLERFGIPFRRSWCESNCSLHFGYK